MSAPAVRALGRLASAMSAGLLFGAGLLLSGMNNPRKVRGFLDIAGSWDPSLAFVMVGAIGVAALAFAWSRRRCAPAQAAVSGCSLPELETARTRIDSSLVLGSAAFGVGWGLSGFCPGPALLTPAAQSAPGVLFLAAMLAGMFLHAGLSRLR
jgi:uncharacterized membrane protein YedE/YeeE